LLPGGGEPDAKHDDGGPDHDGIPDAPPDAPPDTLAACPQAPPGCMPFACAPSVSCYYHCGGTNSDRRIWTAAKTACESAAVGCLATIDDAVENACLAARVTAFPGFLWFGYQQAVTTNEPEGGWAWTCDPSAFAAPWGPNEPNDNNGSEDCAAMINTGGDWNDARCSDVIDYICEFPR
jgi:hypothetical protein